LLSTPPHSDAVTVGYRASAYPGTDFHRADMAPSQAHSFRRKPESSIFKELLETWTPFFNGVTTFYETINT